jgi:hypothetical protein
MSGAARLDEARKVAGGVPQEVLLDNTGSQPLGMSMLTATKARCVISI